jgi:predicted RNase H-like HicB family nuclease
MTKTKLTFSLPVSFIKEGNRFVAYSPAIDLSTSGKTYKEAQKRFMEASSAFFEEISEQGTMDEVLRELGWRKVRRRWTPSMIISQESQEISVYA